MFFPAFVNISISCKFSMRIMCLSLRINRNTSPLMKKICMANSSTNSSLTLANITSAATFPAHVQRAYDTLCAHTSRMLRRCLRYMYVCIICIICIYAFCEDVSGAQVSPRLPPCHQGLILGGAGRLLRGKVTRVAQCM